MTSPMDVTQQAATYRRISRRETHSSRATLAIVIAVILILVCAYFATEIVLSFSALPPLLVAMPALARGIAAAPTSEASGILLAAGIVAALVGLVLIIASLTAGRHARHLIESQSTAAIVDNEVIASALARHAASAGHVDPDNVSVSVSHRSAVVRLTPASGVAVDRDAVVAAVDEQLEDYHLTPTLSSSVIISESGRVGA